MSGIGFILKLAGKENFKLDERIGAGYILNTCWKYGWMLIRGYCCSVGYKNIAPDIFVGKHVKIKEKRYLSVGNKTRIHDGVKIDALSSAGVSVGSFCVLGRNTIIESTGSLSSVGVGIEIGNHTSFGSDCYFGAAGGIKIGSDVVAGQYIRFHSENHNFNDLSSLIRNQGVSHKGIRVGNNCWIGAGCVFLDGAEIGDGCVVAANTVVTKKFPPDSVIGGVPAKLLRTRGDLQECIK